MTRLNAAWEILRDPRRREAHDHQRLGAVQGASTVPGQGGPATGAADPPPPSAGRYEPGGDPVRRSADPHWFGAAGPPRGRASGSVLDFGLYKGWSLGQIACADAGYLAWLLERREDHRHREKIERLLEEIGVRRTSDGRQPQGRLHFRRA